MNIKRVPKIGRNYSAKFTLTSSGVEDFLLAFASPLGYNNNDDGNNDNNNDDDDDDDNNNNNIHKTVKGS